MAIPADFRAFAFDVNRMKDCGKHVGRRTYWKLYAVENILRVIVHSILTVQLTGGWWDVAVDAPTRRNAERLRRQYRNLPGERAIRRQGIYYIGLRDLGEILRANANLFAPAISDVDTLVLGLERLFMPRNLVAHSNYPVAAQLDLIDKFYKDCELLLRNVEDMNVNLLVPD